MYNKFNSYSIILILLLNSTFSEWIRNFNDEFDGNSLNLNRWTPQTLIISDQQYLSENIEIINGSLRLSTSEKVCGNDTVLTASQLFNSKGGWNEGLFEMRAKFPKGESLMSSVWLRSANSDSQNQRMDKIDFVSVINQEPYMIRSGIVSGINNKFSGFEGILPLDITNDYNVFTMEWKKNFICWRINGNIYWNESTFIDRYFESEIGKSFTKRSCILFKISRTSNALNDKNSWTNPFLFVDYIRIYEWRISEIPDHNIPEIGDHKSGTERINSSTISLVFLAFVISILLITAAIVHYIKWKRRENAKNIFNKRKMSSDTSKNGDNQQNIDQYSSLYDEYYENSHNYDIIESIAERNSDNFYLQIN